MWKPPSSGTFELNTRYELKMIRREYVYAGLTCMDVIMKARRFGSDDKFLPVCPMPSGFLPADKQGHLTASFLIDISPALPVIKGATLDTSVVLEIQNVQSIYFTKYLDSYTIEFYMDENELKWCLRHKAFHGRVIRPASRG